MDGQGFFGWALSINSSCSFLRSFRYVLTVAHLHGVPVASIQIYYQLLHITLGKIISVTILINNNSW